MKSFLNPYNFISLPEKKAPAYAEDEKKTITGKIHYEVTTKSPLFIPNTSTDETFAQSAQVDKHKSYDFFSYKELLPYSQAHKNPEPQKPVIPGSEMRGVIRSVYETLTDSCMGVLNSETMPVKRSPAQFQPGLIKKSSRGYELWKAESYRIGRAAESRGMAPPDFGEERNGTRIFFRYPGTSTREYFDKRLKKTGTKKWKNCITEYNIAKDGEKPSQNKETGYLIKWGMGCKKIRYHLFRAIEEKETDKLPILSREDIEIKLLGVIESYLEQPLVNFDIL